MAGLPAPVSRTDELIIALHDQVVGLRADLAAARGGETTTAEPGLVELTEPGPASTARTRKRTSS